MRARDEIVGDLERAYREAFERAQEGGDADAMARLDFDFQRDQLWFEALLDIRELLEGSDAEVPEEKSLLDQAKALRNISKGRLP